MRRTRLRLIVLSSLSILSGAGAWTSASAQPAPDDWQITIAPYMMGAGMNGTTGIANQEITVDASASDIFSNLQFGAMGIFIARKGEWGVGGDFIWMSLGTTVDQPAANVDADQGAFAFYGLRRLGPAADVTFGMRWNHLKTSLGFKGPLQNTAAMTKDWVDPVVGLHLRTQGNGRLHARLYSEIGGFGVGSTFAWQIFPTVGVNVGKHAGLDVGYRWLDINYESGQDLERFKYDVLTQGPVVGFTFTF